MPTEGHQAYGEHLPPPSRQWKDLFKGGFGGQGLYVSPVRDLVIAFSGTPTASGSVNQLRWVSRRLAVTHFPVAPTDD